MFNESPLVPNLVPPRTVDGFFGFLEVLVSPHGGGQIPGQEKTTLPLGPVQTGPEFYAKGRLGFGVCAACVVTGSRWNIGWVSRVLEV